MEEVITNSIRKYAVKNAHEYGSANNASVMSKIISLFPEVKNDMRALALKTNEIIKEINLMKASDLDALYAKFSEEFLSEKKIKDEQSKVKLILPGAKEGNFITRFPPEPSGFMHIGHAKVAYLEKSFKEIYKGKLFLHFDDTNPEKCTQAYVNQIKTDLKWLKIEFDKEYYSSDHIELMYNYIDKLFKKDMAYVCLCDSDKIKDGRASKRPCEHRFYDQKKNVELFAMMLNRKFNENEAIVRFKGAMDSDNTTMRDPTLFRIKLAPHYRQKDKYVVWPTYYFNTAIVDSINGITDVIRSKEYELGDILYERVLKALDLRVPNLHSESRLNIRGNITKKRELRKLVESGSLMGYDDPRLVTIAGLRKRGIMPKAIESFVLRFGMSKVDSSVDISLLLAENKKIIDIIAKRLYFVQNPIELKIKNHEIENISIPLHPSDSSIGSRLITVGNTLYISNDDANLLKVGEVVKLKELFAVKILNINKDGKSIECEIAKNSSPEKKIQWVSNRDKVETYVLVPKDISKNDGTFILDSLETINGYGESYINRLSDMEIIQFERFGFCSAHASDKGNYFIFISK